MYNKDRISIRLLLLYSSSIRLCSINIYHTITLGRVMLKGPYNLERNNILALKDSYLCIAFMFNGGQIPALTIHPIDTRICMVLKTCKQ